MEGHDDDIDAAGGTPVPADDRLWRHPAERGAEQAAANLAARRTHGRRWPTNVMSFLAGASLVGLAWLLQDNEPSVIEETVVQQITPTTATIPIDGPLRFDDWAEEVAMTNINSVIGLEFGDGAMVQSANAVLYADDGHLITTAHAIGTTEDITAVLPSGASIPARIVAIDAVSGVAVLRINSPELPPPSFGDERSVRRGDRLVAIGRNDMSSASIRTVDVVAKEYVAPAGEKHTLTGLMRLTEEIDHSFTGAPIVDEHGGIVAMAVGADNGSTHAMPITRVRAVAAELIETGETAHRAWMGVKTEPVNSALRERRDLRGGVLVSRVWERTPAARAGLQAGDVIVAAGTANIVGFADLSTILRAASPGDSIEILVSRVRTLNAQDDAAEPPEPELLTIVVTLEATSTHLTR